jgi:hypothetical protein
LITPIPSSAMPDWSPGDVIRAYKTGLIVLDDGTTTWNPERAAQFLKGQIVTRLEALIVIATALEEVEALIELAPPPQMTPGIVGIHEKLSELLEGIKAHDAHSL